MKLSDGTETEPRVINSVKVIKAIEITFCGGEFTDESPGREIKRYYDMNGRLLGEYDRFKIAKEREARKPSRKQYPSQS